MNTPPIETFSSHRAIYCANETGDLCWTKDYMALRTALEAERAKVVELKAEVEKLIQVDFSNTAIISTLRIERDEAQGEVIMKGVSCCVLREKCDSLAALVVKKDEAILELLLAMDIAQPDALLANGPACSKARDAQALTPADLADCVCVKREEWQEWKKFRTFIPELQELAALRSSQEWRSIETAPLMQDVLVSLDTGGVAVHRKSAHGTWSCWGESSSPTAWLPLPHAGKEKGT